MYIGKLFTLSNKLDQKSHSEKEVYFKYFGLLFVL